MKVLLLVCLLAAAMTLKPSEAGVNDWHLSNVGEVRSLSFAKSKLQYVSVLGQIGILDRLTGKVESRFVVPESERVVGWSRGELSVATRHNQVVTYSFKPSGVDSAVNNHVLGDRKKVESFAKVGKKEYFLSAQTLLEDKTEIREARPEEEFLRVAGGVRSDGVEVVYLAYTSAGQLCIENYQSYNFLKTYCVEGAKNIHEMTFHNTRLFLSLPTNTYILTEDL